MAVDILEARQSLENRISGLASGTGVSFGTKEIIVYVNDYHSETEIRNRIGTSYQGFPLKFIVSGRIQGLFFQ